MICYKCGEKVDNSDRFCKFCGAALSKPKEKTKSKDRQKDIGIKSISQQGNKKKEIKPIDNQAVFPKWITIKTEVKTNKPKEEPIKPIVNQPAKPKEVVIKPISNQPSKPKEVAKPTPNQPVKQKEVAIKPIVDQTSKAKEVAIKPIVNQTNKPKDTNKSPKSKWITIKPDDVEPSANKLKEITIQPEATEPIKQKPVAIKPVNVDPKLRSIKIYSPAGEEELDSEKANEKRVSLLLEVLLLVIIFVVVIAWVLINGGRNRVYCVVTNSEGKKIKDMEYYLYSGNSKVSLYVERIYSYYIDEDDALDYYNKRKDDCDNLLNDLERCYYSVNGNTVIKTIEKDFENYQITTCKNKDVTQKKDCMKNYTQCLNTNCVRYNNKEVLELAEEVLASGSSDITVKCK